MTFLEKLFLYDRIDDFIHRKGTGSRKEFAKKLNVEIRSLNNYLDDFRQLGAEIDFCRTRNSYYYENDFRFKLEDICQCKYGENVKGGSFLDVFLEGENFLHRRDVFLW